MKEKGRDTNKKLGVGKAGKTRGKLMQIEK
jgi:hypothetical protein